MRDRRSAVTMFSSPMIVRTWSMRFVLAVEAVRTEVVAPVLVAVLDERRRHAADVGFALEDRHPVTALDEFVAAGQAREASTEDDDVFAHSWTVVLLDPRCEVVGATRRGLQRGSNRADENRRSTVCRRPPSRGQVYRCQRGCRADSRISAKVLPSPAAYDVIALNIDPGGLGLRAEASRSASTRRPNAPGRSPGSR